MAAIELSTGELIAPVACFLTMLLVLLGGFGLLYKAVRGVESSLKAEIHGFHKASSVEPKELHRRVDAFARNAKQVSALDRRRARMEGASGTAIIDALRKLIS